jgi:hypothetical protein
MAADKPPLGIMPRHIWESKRILELICTFDRYLNANYPLPIEWVEEYNYLLGRLKPSE